MSASFAKSVTKTTEEKLIKIKSFPFCLKQENDAFYTFLEEKIGIKFIFLNRFWYNNFWYV